MIQPKNWGRNDPPMKQDRNDPPQLGRNNSPQKSGRNDPGRNEMTEREQDRNDPDSPTVTVISSPFRAIVSFINMASQLVNGVLNGDAKTEVSQSKKPRLTEKKVTVVLGTQWGDEGKGKIVDMLATSADVVCRCQVCLHRAHCYCIIS